MKQQKELVEAKLEVGETSWAAQVAKRKAAKASCDESFVKNMRAILNKLTAKGPRCFKVSALLY